VPANFDQGTIRLSDLQRNRAADATLKNLLSTLTDQIQTCAKLAVFEYEADSEGHPALAIAFRDLGESERASFDTLLEYLRRHLNEQQPEAPPAAVRRAPTQAANR
jgi:DnaJ-domain-containing protein 1